MAPSPKPVAERRTVDHPFLIRISAVERAAWVAAADGAPTSRWARDVLNRAAQRAAEGRRGKKKSPSD